MIIFDLQCDPAEHVFEAWFSNSESFEDQRGRGLISCPICASTSITKALMAPNISAKGNRAASKEKTSSDETLPVATHRLGDGRASEMQAMLGKIAEIQAEGLKDSTWVGKDFEKQARAMDAGTIDQASIHGQVSPEQAKSMIDDGIAVMPLLVPIVPPEERN
jgi:hypothetical protein